MAQALDHNTNVYLSVTLATGSSLFSTPSSLAGTHSLLRHQGPVGALPDVQLYSIPKPDWDNIHEESAVKKREGVVRVDVVQPPRQRSRRDGF
ncbi:hypothetical protein AN958_02920 [Leucoagaricus sp. SymC.cos]|nr:hypothetical protein AN958_02920 [Leucoagaricus sp. SymC.cos]